MKSSLVPGGFTRTGEGQVKKKKMKNNKKIEKQKKKEKYCDRLCWHICCLRGASFRKKMCVGCEGAGGDFFF